MTVLQATKDFVKAFKDDFKSKVARGNGYYSWTDERVSNYVRLIIQYGINNNFITKDGGEVMIKSLKYVKCLKMRTKCRKRNRSTKTSIGRQGRKKCAQKKAIYPHYVRRLIKNLPEKNLPRNLDKTFISKHT